MLIESELSDINNFSFAVKVMGFAGVYFRTFQSGEYSALRTALPKCGLRYLRKSLYQCILLVCTNYLTFNNYYKLKRLQGKSHSWGWGHSVHKFIRIIYKTVIRNIQFDEKVYKIQFLK